MEITADQVKSLRDRTGAGVMACKRALTEAGGNVERAIEILRERGFAQVAKRADRVATEGVIEAYVHAGGRIGVLVEVNCESDFVARTPEFRTLAHEIALQIAAMNPPSISREQGVEGAEGTPLLEQPFIRDPSRTIGDLIRETAAKTGENIVVRRFTRYELGA